MTRTLREVLFNVARNVAADQRSADFLRIERRDLFVERADTDAFFIVKYRAVGGAGDVILGEFRLGTHVNHLVKLGELCYGNLLVITQ